MLALSVVLDVVTKRDGNIRHQFKMKILLVSRELRVCLLHDGQASMGAKRV